MDNGPRAVIYSKGQEPQSAGHGFPRMKRGLGLVSGGIWRVKEHTDLASNGVSPQKLDPLSANLREYTASDGVRMKCEITRRVPGAL